ncbi:MAG: bifunctional UDP-N-acetylglucosamine diphosphorylase/glucosamine-1-phosphate N-acetyltransferase GlmU [Anaerolineales bacterium]|nr:bifunctional UDP-N-acetylglucosamine diphosphorylase/glucosamine-1-phosphate N-acetyltransferase GlmU [Anaerolineales bacterium]
MRANAIILAAGLGTRMKSRIPKVLHELGGKPLVRWSVEACTKAVGAPPTVIVGLDMPGVRAAAGEACSFVEQRERLGTGHAVLQARAALQEQGGIVVVANADLPFVRSESYRALIARQGENPGPLTLLTAEADYPRGFGRVKRDDRGRVAAIIEHAHASEEELAIRELNVGVYAFRSDWLWSHLDDLPVSPKGEYYLTDLIAMAASEGEPIETVTVAEEDEIIGINTRVHLAEAEKALRERINRMWMEAGVTMIDPATTYIGPDVQIGQDTVLLPNTHLLGEVFMGSDCKIGPNTTIRDASIGDGCTIDASVVEGAVLEQDVEIGPYGHLREGAHLGRGVHMGNYGEVKNSRLEAGVKIGHFSYIGDAHIGENVNIGAGTITCNYDGEKKHRTEIGAEAFIGSDTMLVAPVKIGKGARTGAGSVVTKDVPDYGLAVGIPARVIRKLDERD